MSSYLKSLDLASRLRAKQRRPWPNLALFLVSGVLLSAGVLAFASAGLPWHWQLFGRWLTRQGELTEIPAHLHSELRHLCQAAAPRCYDLQT